MLCVLYTLGLLEIIQAQAVPAEIIIISHAEKDKSQEKDQPQDINLNAQGFIRAHALVPYFVDIQLKPGGMLPPATVDRGDSSYLPAKYGEPFALFAKGQKTSSNSARAIQTLEPIASALGLAINTVHMPKEKFDTHDPSKYADLYTAPLIDEIIDNEKYNQKRILICWRHGSIPTVIQAILNKENRNLLVPTAISKSAAFKKYDRIIRMSFNQGKIAKIENIPQQLLLNDSKKSTYQVFFY